MKPESSAERGQQLRELEYHWTDTDGGAAYVFTFRDGHYVATRTDNGRELIADTAGELRELVIVDYSENRVERQKVSLS